MKCTKCDQEVHPQAHLLGLCDACLRKISSDEVGACKYCGHATSEKDVYGEFDCKCYDRLRAATQQR